MTSCTLYKEQAVVVGLVAGVEPGAAGELVGVAERAAAREGEVPQVVAAVHLVVVWEEPGKIGFLSR